MLKRSQTWDPRNVGSAKTLVGNVYILSCFVSNSNNEWSLVEKNEIYRKNYEALYWVKKQASRYNINVNFEHGQYGLEADIKYNYEIYDVCAGKGKSGVLPGVLKKIGYSSNMECYNWVVKNKICDNVFVQIFIKDMAVSYAVPYYVESTNREEYLENVVLFHRDPTYGIEIYSSMMIHEILHVFGAWDLYANFAQSAEAEKYARELFPKSVMLRVLSHNINELEVDPLTAWLIGWNKNPEAWYEWFNPYR